MQDLTLKHISMAVVAGALFLTTASASALTAVQVDKLLANDGMSGDGFGIAVAVSGIGLIQISQAVRRQRPVGDPHHAPAE